MMETIFNRLSDKLISTLKKGEHLIISFDGEKSQFIRFNNASIRQTGLVDDATMSLKFIANGRTCHGAFTVSGNQDIDIQNFYMEYCSTLKNERNPGKAVISNLKHALNELESPNEDLWKKNVPCTPWMKYWN